MRKLLKTKRRKLGKLLTLTLFLLMITMVISTGSAVMLGPHEIVFVSRVCNVDGTSTWTYNVTCGGSPEISHWIIAWCGGDSSIIDASHRYEYVDDPTTGVRGIKFDEGVDGGETVTFWFTLDKCYAEGNVQVAIKAGKNVYIGTITGPVFSYDVSAHVQGEGPETTYMNATATTDYSGITTVTFRWYGPFSETETPGPEPSKLKLTDPDSTAPFESIYGPLTEDDLGTWYITAEFQGPYHPGLAYTILTPTLVPWFTSLPLVLLVTIGLLAYLKRKPAQVHV